MLALESSWRRCNVRIKVDAPVRELAELSSLLDLGGLLGVLLSLQKDSTLARHVLLSVFSAHAAAAEHTRGAVEDDAAASQGGKCART